jgi:hypothetical protein
MPSILEVYHQQENMMVSNVAIVVTYSQIFQTYAYFTFFWAF